MALVQIIILVIAFSISAETGIILILTLITIKIASKAIRTVCHAVRKLYRMISNRKRYELETIPPGTRQHEPEPYYKAMQKISDCKNDISFYTVYIGQIRRKIHELEQSRENMTASGHDVKKSEAYNKQIERLNNNLYKYRKQLRKSQYTRAAAIRTLDRLGYNDIVADLIRGGSETI